MLNKKGTACDCWRQQRMRSQFEALPEPASEDQGEIIFLDPGEIYPENQGESKTLFTKPMMFTWL